MKKETIFKRFLKWLFSFFKKGQNDVIGIKKATPERITSRKRIRVKKGKLKYSLLVIQSTKKKTKQTFSRH